MIKCNFIGILLIIKEVYTNSNCKKKWLSQIRLCRAKMKKKILIRVYFRKERLNSKSSFLAFKISSFSKLYLAYPFICLITWFNVINNDMWHTKKNHDLVWKTFFFFFKRLKLNNISQIIIMIIIIIIIIIILSERDFTNHII